MHERLIVCFLLIASTMSTASSKPTVLVLGGHGSIAMLITSRMLALSWPVTSVIRASHQQKDVHRLAKDQPGTVTTLMQDLSMCTNESEARVILDQVQPNYIVWAAGTTKLGLPEKS
jgi:hypothetical protein